MGSIKKSLHVKEIECVLYDRTTKQERTETIKVSEVEKMPELPENCVLLEQRTVSEKEVVYSMSPDVFVKHASIVEE